MSNRVISAFIVRTTTGRGHNSKSPLRHIRHLSEHPNLNRVFHIYIIYSPFRAFRCLSLGTGFKAPSRVPSTWIYRDFSACHYHPKFTVLAPGVGSYTCLQLIPAAFPPTRERQTIYGTIVNIWHAWKGTIVTFQSCLVHLRKQCSSCMRSACETIRRYERKWYVREESLQLFLVIYLIWSERGQILVMTES